MVASNRSRLRDSEWQLAQTQSGQKQKRWGWQLPLFPNETGRTVPPSLPLLINTFDVCVVACPWRYVGSLEEL